MKKKIFLSLTILLGSTLVSCNVRGSSNEISSSLSSSETISSNENSSSSESSSSSENSSSSSSSSMTGEQEIITYKVIFNTGSTRIIEPILYEPGASVSVEDLPILDDRNDSETPKFVCWTLNNQDVTDTFTMPNENVELVAKYRAYESWTIKYQTNIVGYNIEDTVIYENQGLDEYVFPVFNYPYKKLDGWYYDSSLTTKVGDSLDETKFVDSELTLYASVGDTNLSSASWEYSEGKYSGKGYTQVKNVVDFSSKKTTKVTVELPAYNKSAGAYGTTEIYFGGDDDLIVNNSVKSGYALFICGLDDNSPDVGVNKDPRAGSMALYKYNKDTNARVMVSACRRYVEPLLSSSYYASYNNYMNSGTSKLEFDIEFIIGEEKSYILVEGTTLMEFDYNPDGNGFGLYTNATYPTSVSFTSISTTDSGKTTVTFDKDGGIGEANTIEVPYGSKLGTLPTLTKDNASFQGWANDNSVVTEDYIPGLTASISLKAQYGEYVPVRNVWDGSIATSIANGTGTESDPYLINTCSELAFISQEINAQRGTYNKAYYKLGNYLDLNGKTWTPIGLQTYPFQGTFDGDGKSIVGLKVDRAGATGLFGHIADAYIKNVDITGSVNSTGVNSGILVGRAQISTIENCITRGTLTSNNSYTGAILATVNAYQSGVTGSQTKMIIKNCTNFATVTSTMEGNTFVGGILAQYADTVSTEITGCINRGNITGGGNYIGGIIAFVRKNESSFIKNCYNYGDITSGTKSRFTGGITGFNRGLIEGCYGYEGAKVNAVLGSSTTAKLYPTSNGTNVPGGIICGHWDTVANCTSNTGFVNCGMCDSEGAAVTK